MARLREVRQMRTSRASHASAGTPAPARVAANAAARAVVRHGTRAAAARTAPGRHHPARAAAGRTWHLLFVLGPRAHQRVAIDTRLRDRRELLVGRLLFVERLSQQ